MWLLHVSPASRDSVGLSSPNTGHVFACVICRQLCCLPFDGILLLCCDHPDLKIIFSVYVFPKEIRKILNLRDDFSASLSAILDADNF